MSSSAAGPEGAVPPMLRAAGAQGGPCYLGGGGELVQAVLDWYVSSTCEHHLHRWELTADHAEAREDTSPLCGSGSQPLPLCACSALGCLCPAAHLAVVWRHG